MANFFKGLRPSWGKVKKAITLHHHQHLQYAVSQRKTRAISAANELQAPFFCEGGGNQMISLLTETWIDLLGPQKTHIEAHNNEEHRGNGKRTMEGCAIGVPLPSPEELHGRASRSVCSCGLCLPRLLRCLRRPKLPLWGSVPGARKKRKYRVVDSSYSSSSLVLHLHYVLHEEFLNNHQGTMQ